MCWNCLPTPAVNIVQQNRTGVKAFARALISVWGYKPYDLFSERKVIFYEVQLSYEGQEAAIWPFDLSTETNAFANDRNHLKRYLLETGTETETGWG